MGIKEENDSFLEKFESLKQSILEINTKMESLDQVKLNNNKFTENCDKVDKLLTKLDDIAVNQ